MVQDAIEYLAKEWSVISQAPALFTIALALLCLIAFAASRWQFSSRLESKDGIIGLKEAEINDYKRKLDGASPDEAKRRLDELELLVLALSPRRLAKEQAEKLTNYLLSVRGWIDISQDAGAPDAKAFTGDIAVAFQRAGWHVSLPMVMGIGNHPPTGLGLIVHDVHSLQPAENAVREAFDAAGVAYNIQRGRRPRRELPKMPEDMPFLGIEEPDVELLITARLS